jgi:hypothetical protein
MSEPPEPASNTRNVINTAIRAGWDLPFRGEIYEYGRQIDLQEGYAIKGNFEVERSRYLIEPFKALRDPRVRKVIVLKAVQTGGTLLSDIWIPYIITCDPGDLLWLFQDDDFAGRYMDQRFIPGCLKRAPGVMELLDAKGKFALQRKQFLLPSMSALIGGLNEGNVQSLSKRYVIITEAWMAHSNGLIRQAIARTTAYPHTSKVFIESQGGIEGEDLDLQWNESTKAALHWNCPHCSFSQPFEFSRKREDGSWAGMKWDTNDITCPNGYWNYDLVGQTARYECFQCRQRIEDQPLVRRQLNDSYHYVITNTKAEAGVLGFHWPSEANIDNSFAGLVVEYLKAKAQDEQFGYRLPLQEFYQKRRAINWNPNLTMDVVRSAYEPYDASADWPQERFRFLLVDCQKDLKEFWWIVRAVALDGESRQLARGKAESFEQIAKLQELWKIKDNRVFLDGGYEQTRVAQECVQHGHIATQRVGSITRKVWLCWIILKGSGLHSFQHTHPQTEVKEDRIYSRLDYIDPHIGKKINGKQHNFRVPYYNWSNLQVKDILRRYRDQDHAPKFLCLPDDAPPSDVFSYTSQMNSEIRERQFNERGQKITIWRPIPRRPNHWWDCEAMFIAVCAIVGIIGAPDPELVLAE